MLIISRYFGRLRSKLLISHDIIIFLAIAVVTFIAHFWHLRSFGLYEDDYIFIAPFLDITGQELWEKVWWTNLHFQQGHPLGFSFAYILSFIGAKIGGLQAIYYIAYLVVFGNAFIFYLLTKQIYNQPIFGVTAAFAYALYPADTTQAFLTHSLYLQVSLTLFLIASITYFKQKYIWSYLLIFLSLLTYESPFLIFLAVPLFRIQWNSRLLIKIFRHSLILAIMIIITVIIRKIVGEDRVTNLDFLTMIQTPFMQMAKGPFISMAMFFYRPFETLIVAKENKDLMMAIITCFLGLTWLFLTKLKFAYTDLPSDYAHGFSNLDEQINIPDQLRPLPRIAITSLGMLILSYPLTFTVPATEISGRASRVHLGAIFGSTLLFACLCTVFFYYARKYRLKNLFSILLAFYFSLLVGFGLTVQKDNQLAWQYQKAFWRDVVFNLFPDMTDGTVIMIEPNVLPWGKQLHPFNMLMWVVIQNIFKFPSSWKYPPQLIKLEDPNYQQKILTAKQFFQLNKEILGAGYWDNRIVSSPNIIFLEKKDDQLVRRSEPLIINGQEFPLKKKSSSTLANYPRRPLYNLLIESPLDRNINYLAPVDKSQAEKASILTLRLIDDLEHKDGVNALGGGWFTYNDKANGGDSDVFPAPGMFTSSVGGANGSMRAAKMTGKVTKTFPSSNIAIGTTLGKNPIDVSKYKGIEFWAKGDGKEYQLQLQTPLIKDFNFYNYVFTSQPEWTRYEVRFDQIKQEDWGKKTVTVPERDILTKINSIVWRTYPMGQSRESVELAIDDIKFLK